MSVESPSTGSPVNMTSLPFFSWFLSQPLGIEDRLPVTLGFIVVSLIGLLTRVITPRDELSRSVPAVELFFNRLLFDRDIRDRKAWTERNLRQQPKS